MAYIDLLRDPKWQRRRTEVMRLADFTCQWCGDKKTTLNVHHKYYRRGCKPWEYENRDLLCLCEPCHRAATAWQDEVARLVGELGSSAGVMVGFGRAFLADSRPPGHCSIPIQVEDLDVAIGVASAYGVSLIDLMNAVPKGGGSVSTRSLEKMRGAL